MSPTLNRPQVEALIPHRAPILMVDAVTGWEADKWIETTFHVAENNPHFAGHFPGTPVFPGVLTVEAMAQSAAILTSLSTGLNAETSAYLFTGMENVQFRGQVLANQTLAMRIEKIRDRLGIYQFNGTTTVNGTLVTKASFTAKLIRK